MLMCPCFLCTYQNGEDFLVRTHHMEYCEGDILDLDDLLTDLVEDRDKVRPNDVNINIHHENIYVWWSLCLT